MPQKYKKEGHLKKMLLLQWRIGRIIKCKNRQENKRKQNKSNRKATAFPER